MAQKIGQVKILFSKKEMIDYYTKEESEKKWETLFAVVSGAYIYFYETSDDKYPKHYFYLSEIKIEKHHEENDEPQHLELINILSQVLYL